MVQLRVGIHFLMFWHPYDKLVPRRVHAHKERQIIKMIIPSLTLRSDHEKFRGWKENLNEMNFCVWVLKGE